MKKWLFKKLWVDVLFDQDSIFLIGSMSIVYGLCTPPNVLKGGGGSSNVHIVLKGGSSKCSCPFTRGREGVKIVPNPVHVVCECPLNKK